MFSNIGQKIKTVSKVICAFGMIASIAYGIMLVSAGVAENSDRFSQGSGTSMIILGLIIMIVGPIMFWLSVLITYAFGQLVDNVDFISSYIKDSCDNQNILLDNDTLSNDELSQLQSSNKSIQNNSYVSESSANDIPNNDHEWVSVGNRKAQCPICGQIKSIFYLNIYEKCPRCGFHY